jgi:predicted lipase
MFNIKSREELDIFVKKYNIAYDFYSKTNIILLKDLNKVVNYFKIKNNSMMYTDLVKNNILETLYKLSAITYNRKLVSLLPKINKRVVKSKNKLFILFNIGNTLLVVIRGTKNLKELKEGVYGSSRIKYKFEKKETYDNFIEWKEKYIKSCKPGKSNINLPKMCHKNIYVHQEYYNKSRKMITELRDVIDKGKFKNIIISGHSMGGSLSMICGLKLKEIYGTKLKINIVSFSNLGIGNRNLSLFSLFLGVDSYIRVYNKSDYIDLYRSGILFKIVGRLRHLNHSIPTNNKKYIIHDTEKYIPKSLLNLIKKQSIYNRFLLSHLLIKFDNNTKSKIYIM